MSEIFAQICVTPSHLSSQTCSSEKLEQQTEADYSDSDPWRITEEQLDYYTNQFKSLQPDLGALILGKGQMHRFTARNDTCNLFHC